MLILKRCDICQNYIGLKYMLYIAVIKALSLDDFISKSKPYESRLNGLNHVLWLQVRHRNRRTYHAFLIQIYIRQILRIPGR